jgi:carbon storage regulator
MLVLSRKEGERIVIGNRQVIVTVLGIRGDKVRLGFSAGPDIIIVRSELLSPLLDGRHDLPAAREGSIDDGSPA